MRRFLMKEAWYQCSLLSRRSVAFHRKAAQVGPGNEASISVQSVLSNINVIISGSSVGKTETSEKY